jgi:N-acylneuraminate cytidylyltransferase
MKTIYDRLCKERPELIEKFKKIRFIATDFDGVWTDNKVMHHADGTEAVYRSKADSMGIDVLKAAGAYDKENMRATEEGLDIMIMSKERNKVVGSVCDKIKVRGITSEDDKITALEKEVRERGLKYEEVCFIGNDINDIGPMKKAGIGIAVADAIEQVRRSDVADYVTEHRGGDGAVREVIELILYAKGIHPYP